MLSKKLVQYDSRLFCVSWPHRHRRPCFNRGDAMMNNKSFYQVVLCVAHGVALWPDGQTYIFVFCIFDSACEHEWELHENKVKSGTI